MKLTRIRKRRSNLENITGKTIASLTFKNHIKGDWWFTKCSCGSEQIQKKSQIKMGRVKSCGKCIKKIPSNRLPKGVASFNVVYKRYLAQAQQRGYVFKLTREEFAELTKKNCHYCGTLPNQVSFPKTSFAGYTYMGVDRKENGKGYTVDNSVPCCRICNRAKNSMEYKDFITWIEKLKVWKVST